MRHAFQNVWELNVKAIPTSLVWAISFWFILESPSLLIKLLAVFTANMAALASAKIIMKQERPGLSINFLSFARDPFVWKTLHGIGILLVMSLFNVSRQSEASPIVKLFFVAVTLSVLFIWIIATVALVPIMAKWHANDENFDMLKIGIFLMGLQKRHLFLSISIILFSWPLIFFYVFIALTLSQSLIFSQISELKDQHFVVSKTLVNNA